MSRNSPGRPGLVAVKLPVVRDGKMFEQTFWKTPAEAKKLKEKYNVKKTHEKMGTSPKYHSTVAKDDTKDWAKRKVESGKEAIGKTGEKTDPFKSAEKDAIRHLLGEEIDSQQLDGKLERGEKLKLLGQLRRADSPKDFKDLITNVTGEELPLDKWLKKWAGKGKVWTVDSAAEEWRSSGRSKR